MLFSNLLEEDIEKSLASRKKEAMRVGNPLIVWRVGFLHEGFYLVKIHDLNPLVVEVFDEVIFWERSTFRVSWQHTFSFQEDHYGFLRKIQNQLVLATGLTEFGNEKDSGFINIARYFPCWLNTKPQKENH